MLLLCSDKASNCVNNSSVITRYNNSTVYCIPSSLIKNHMLHGKSIVCGEDLGVSPHKKRFALLLCLHVSL